MRKSRQRIQVFLIAVVFLIGAAAFFVPLAAQIYEVQTDDAEYADLAELLHTPEVTAEPLLITDTPDLTEVPTSVESDADPTITPIASTAPTASPVPTNTPLAPETPMAAQTTKAPAIRTEAPATSQPDRFAAYRKQNPDFIAWLKIPGTPVDYPVVQSDDTEWYLNHLFTGKQSKLGCLFSLKNADYQTPGRNIAIYGHHLSASSAMFSSLMNYKSESYWKQHSTIRLDSLYHSSQYRVFAVINMDVSDWDAATASFSSSADFMRFVNRARDKALYSTDIQVTENDRVLTLITCDRSYGGASGRLILMAVETK